MTHSGADIATLLAAHGLRPSRALGQNFVADPNTVRRIARLADIGPGSSVLEFGAGLGSLSLALAETGARVVAVELDRHLLPVLRSVVEPVGVEVVAGGCHDARRGRSPGGRGAGARGRWWPTCPTTSPPPWSCGHWSRCRRSTGCWSWCSARSVSGWRPQVGDPAYGSVSVRVAYFARSSVAGKVPASVFIPRPRVESVLVRMERRPEPAVPLDEVTYERLAAVVKAGFGQRRKMLRSSLAGVVTPEAFVRAGIRPEARAEELTVEEWGRLAQ